MLQKQTLKRGVLLLAMLSFVTLATAFQTAKAAEITSATLNKEVYLAGQTGYISVAIYNDKNANISITELSATIDYYYTDGTVYVQKFFTSTSQLEEIEPGQTETYQIPISLPTNIASGYTNLMVQTKTELWINLTGRWIPSDSPDQIVKLYIESPYKQMNEDSQTQLQTAQEQLENKETANQNLNVTTTVLGVTTLVFGGVVALLMILILKEPKHTAQPP